MVGVKVSNDATLITIVGHGIDILENFEVSSGVFIVPDVCEYETQKIADGCEVFLEYAAILTGATIANFSLQISDESGGKDLAVKGWNSLWLFHLLSIACSTPVCSLYSVSGASSPKFGYANRNIMTRPFPKIVTATSNQLEWVRTCE